MCDHPGPVFHGDRPCALSILRTEMRPDQSHLKRTRWDRHDLQTFLCNDGKYERVITGYNLYARYRMGTYPGIMGMYEMDDNNCLRRLVEEFYHYKRDILLKVEPESCYFVLQWKSEEDQMKEQKNLWYKNPGLEWTMAQRTEDGECIPTKPFEFVFIPDDPVVEASVLITFLPAEVKKFSLDALENIYELNVEVW